MRIVSVNLNAGSYPIYIGQGLLTDPKFAWPTLSEEVLVVSDTTVAPLYLSALQSRCQGLRYNEVVLPAGEAYKSLTTVNHIFDAFIAGSHSRQTTLIALGGGVVGDMTGFAAACYQRGVKFMQVPTTLLAQVDSAVGGKTAVNHCQAKNMIGAFHQPVAVVSDVDTLQSLPAREYAAGLAEILKYGLIWDAEFFAWLEQQTATLLARDPATLIAAIARSCEIKAEIVSLDPTEQGLRAILNFGHSFAHAIEQVMGYGTLLHGEAVAIGICRALDLSQCLGLINADLKLRSETWLRAMQLPIKIPAHCTNEKLLAAMAIDKKRVGNKMRFIVLTQLGHAEIYADIVPELIENVLAAGQS